MVPAVEQVVAGVEDRFFRLVDLAHRELIFENEVVDEIDDRVMLRSIPIKLSRQIYYNTYFSRRKCHLCCIYSLAVTPTRRLIITGVFLSWLHPVAATPKSNLIFTPANATGDETREVILVREVTRAMCPAVEDAGAPKVVAGRCSSRVPLVHNCNCNCKG